VDLGGPNGGDAYQIFYFRRSARDAHPRRSRFRRRQKIVYQQPFVPVLAAVKLTAA